MRHLLLIALLFTAGPAAAIYQCKSPNGTTVFQDSPCPGGGGKQMQVKPARGGDDAAPASSGAAGDDPVEKLKRMQRDSELMGIDREIRDIEYQIERHQANMNTEMSALRAKQARANNNLAGATWLQSVSAEMQAVTDKYKTLIDNDRARIADLRERRNRTAGAQ